MKNAFNIVLVFLLVAGCQQAEDRLQRLAGKKPPKNAIHEARYCYKTLGEINCYNNPKKGWENRLVGHFEPPAPPSAPPPVKKEVVGAETAPTSSTAEIYEIKVEDIAKPQAKPKDPSVPVIKPLIQR